MVQKIAIIAGEASGDALGADLIAAIKQKLNQPIELIGVGGEALKQQGLNSLFDYSELSLMGLTAIIKRLPKLIWRIDKTAKEIIKQQPNILIIVDSPDFTHRVARRVKKSSPNIKIINYVCPTVWAWKPERASKMRSYIDHILSVFPFEPEIVSKLNGPDLTYIGHRLMENKLLDQAYKKQMTKEQIKQTHYDKTILLLPGSRNGELKFSLAPIKQTVIEMTRRQPDTKFIMPTISRLEDTLRQEVSHWPADVQICVGETEKFEAFAQADAALAVSGTVLLELALSRIPCLSIYKADWLAQQFLVKKIKIWTAALPNVIVDYPIIREYFNESIRPAAIARHLEQISAATYQRAAILEAYDRVRDHMQTNECPSHLGADVIISKFL